MCDVLPSLEQFVFENKFKTRTIDFAKPRAVKALNKALLIKYYNISFWEFPDTNLCPPIPGRVDYIHHLCDLLKRSGIAANVSILDIGTGATCIYPLLGNSEYNWTFVGSDIDKNSLKNAKSIINRNRLSSSITLRFQKDSSHVLSNIIKDTDAFSASMCNPPFYKSEKDAKAENKRKLKGLNKEGQTLETRNFSGQSNELYYNGGEKAFLHNYLYESSLFKEQCHWFTSLVSKKDLLKGMYSSLNKLGATDIKTVNMGQGNKISRMVAWTFQ